MTIEEFIKLLNYYQEVSIWHRKGFGYMYSWQNTDIAGEIKLTKNVKNSKITEISAYTNGKIIIHCEDKDENKF